MKPTKNVNAQIDSSHQEQHDDRLKYLEEVSKKMEHRIVQDWRRSNRHSAIYDDRPLQPPAPGPASDMWSYGCVLCEVLTGRKLFQVGDKLSCVLRPAQLLEMKIGDTETLWNDLGHGEMFKVFKDLILHCISSDPDTRLSAEAALSHPVFLETPEPGVKDLFLLPSPHLQFSQFSNTVINTSSAGHDDTDHDTVLQNLKSECSAYGEISECSLANSGHAFVHFEEVSLRQTETAAAFHNSHI